MKAITQSGARANNYWVSNDWYRKEFSAVDTDTSATIVLIRKDLLGNIYTLNPTLTGTSILTKVSPNGSLVAFKYLPPVQEFTVDSSAITGEVYLSMRQAAVSGGVQIVKLNSSLAVDWAYSYKSPNNNVMTIRSMDVKLGDLAVMCSDSTNQLSVLKVSSSDGTFGWWNSYSTAGTSVSAMLKISTNIYIGFQLLTGTLPRAAVIKINLSTGAILWGKIAGTGSTTSWVPSGIAVGGSDNLYVFTVLTTGATGVASLVEFASDGSGGFLRLLPEFSATGTSSEQLITGLSCDFNTGGELTYSFTTSLPAAPGVYVTKLFGTSVVESSRRIPVSGTTIPAISSNHGGLVALSLTGSPVALALNGGSNYGTVAVKHSAVYPAAFGEISFVNNPDKFRLFAIGTGNWGGAGYSTASLGSVTRTAFTYTFNSAVSTYQPSIYMV